MFHLVHKVSFTYENTWQNSCYDFESLCRVYLQDAKVVKENLAMCING